MIDTKCHDFRNDDGCRWCQKYHYFQCDLCHKEDDNEE